MGFIIKSLLWASLPIFLTYPLVPIKASETAPRKFDLWVKNYESSMSQINEIEQLVQRELAAKSQNLSYQGYLKGVLETQIALLQSRLETQTEAVYSAMLERMVIRLQKIVTKLNQNKKNRALSLQRPEGLDSGMQVIRGPSGLLLDFDTLLKKTRTDG